MDKHKTSEKNTYPNFHWRNINHIQLSVLGPGFTLSQLLFHFRQHFFERGNRSVVANTKVCSLPGI